MPLKFIIPVFLIVGAAGVAVYENTELREQIQEFVANARRKLAASLHSIADNVTPQKHRESVPLSGRPLSASGSERTLAETTGRHWGDTTDHELRQRGGGAGAVIKQDNIALFDGSSAFSSNSNTRSQSIVNEKAAITASIAVQSSRRSSTSTLQTPNTADFEIEPESGYESQPPAPAALIQSAPLSQSSTGAGHAQNPFMNSQPFWSIHEWAENAENASSISSPSLAGSAAEELGDVGTDDETTDLVSVSSWTEVGSEISDDHHH